METPFKNHKYNHQFNLLRTNLQTTKTLLSYLIRTVPPTGKYFKIIMVNLIN